MQNLIKMKNIYFQQEFSESTKQRISTFFSFSADEELLCGVWTGAFLRYGFAVSNKGLYWYLKSKNGIKSGAVSKNQYTDIRISKNASSDNSVASLSDSVTEFYTKLEIQSGGKSEEFYITGLSEEKEKTLCDILKFAFTQSVLPQTDLGKLIKSPSLIFLRSFCDEILNIADENNKRLKEFKNSAAKAFHKIMHINFRIIRAENNTESRSTDIEKSEEILSGKQTDESESSETEQTETRDTEKEPVHAAPEKQNPALPFLLNIADIFAGVIIILSLIILRRTNLLYKYASLSEQFSKIGLSVYTVLKCAIAFYSKKTTRKIIALILVFISILSYIMLAYTLTMSSSNGYLLFMIVAVALCILSYFAFEFACGVKTENIIRKIITVAVLTFVVYIMASYMKYDLKKELIDSAREFFRQLSRFLDTL
ncbi:hypothetical protein [Treponema sp.]|uniref:hypothetical protein n=1 Tax=Treponema sp. TaxID=166 RepID=UPI003890E035